MSIVAHVYIQRLGPQDFRKQHTARYLLCVLVAVYTLDTGGLELPFRKTIPSALELPHHTWSSVLNQS